jgi:pyruvate dehydrogenase E2 component (dihydrolipoamide acetyltransferase)
MPTLTPFPAPETTVDPHSNIRRVTAKRLSESKNTAPHFYLTADLDVTALVAFRRRLKARSPGLRLSINDLVLKAVAAALRAVPDVNVSWGDDGLVQHGTVDINVAVDTPRGLLVPIVRDVDRLGLREIGDRVRALAGAAKDGSLSLDDMASGTFTVSNLGAFDIDQFTAIILPPQAAILAVSSTRRVVELDPRYEEEDDHAPPPPASAMRVVQRMKVTLSCDHRAIDGAVGARFLQALRDFVEEPSTMLL